METVQQDEKYQKAVVMEVLKRYREREGTLIRVLQETQKKLGYLPKDALVQIAEGMNLSLSKVYGVATFYSQFHLNPRGRHEIRVCQGTACHVRGAQDIMAAFEKELGIKAGETTSDFEYTLSSVACVGACGLAPVVLIDGKAHGRLLPDDIPQLITREVKH